MIHLFRELMAYCVTMINSSGFYTIALQHTPTVSFRILNFWSCNVFHRVCLGSTLRGMLLPHKILNFISPFLCLFETFLTCVAMIKVGDKLGDCLSTCLPGEQQPANIRTSNPEDFERCLSVPTAQIIERYDFRTILDFMLMKLRTALDRDWPKKLPLFHKVGFMSFLSSNHLELLSHSVSFGV